MLEYWKQLEQYCTFTFATEDLNEILATTIKVMTAAEFNTADFLLAVQMSTEVYQLLWRIREHKTETVFSETLSRYIEEAIDRQPNQALTRDRADMIKWLKEFKSETPEHWEAELELCRMTYPDIALEELN